MDWEQIHCKISDALQAGSETELRKAKEYIAHIETCCRGLTKAINTRLWEKARVYIEQIDGIIWDTYHDVTEIRHGELEVDGLIRFRFDIHWAGTSEQVLADEKICHQRFYDLVPDYMQEWFSFTYTYGGDTDE